MATGGTNPSDEAWAAALKFRPTYAKALGEYFAVYEVKERGIKKWLEDARAAWIAAGSPRGGPNFPPLDDPPAMLAWWLAHKTHAPSATLLALAGKTPADLAPPTPPAPGAAPAQGAAGPAAAPRTAIALDDMAGVDLVTAHAHHGKILAAAMRDHADALNDPHATDTTITLRANRLDAAMERHRKLDAAVREAQIKAGDLIHRTKIRDDAAPLFAAMADSLVSEIVDAFGVPRPAAMHFVDRWFGMLRASRFFTTAVPSNAPTTAAA